jgi:PucR C-terminal helix-turn-helix domain
MSGFAELLAQAGDDPGLLETTVAAARARSPEVAALPEDETRRHTQALIRAGAAALIADGDVREEDLLAAERLGADRARQGVSVAALLDGFQAGRAHLLRRVVDQGRAAGLSADVLLDGLTRFDAVATALERRMVHAHRVAELELARTARDTHTQVLRRTLHGEPGDPAPLDPAVAYHCLVSDVSDPAVARSMEQWLTGGLCGLVDGRLVALLPRLPVLPRAPAVPFADLPRMVAAPAVPFADLPVIYRLCREALRAEPDRPGLVHLADLALATATATRPELGALLAESLLPGLDPASPFHRLLAETALSYLDHALRLESTAAALHVHPNTVKYRIRRFAELTGRSPAPRNGSAVEDAAHWWWALRTWLAAPSPVHERST